MLDAFGAYLDFGLLHDPDGDVALVSVHATRWQPETWAATGSSAPIPQGLRRPWPSDAILDSLLQALESRPAVLAGDWNEDLDFPGPGDPQAAAFRQRAVDAGLVEAVSSTFRGKVRTNLMHQTKNPYQNGSGLPDRRSCGEAPLSVGLVRAGCPAERPRWHHRYLGH